VGYLKIGHDLFHILSSPSSPIILPFKPMEKVLATQLVKKSHPSPPFMKPYPEPTIQNYTRVYPKASGLTAWSEDCKWYSSLPLGTVKVKVKLSLCLTKHHTMKTYWGNRGIAPSILDLGTRWR
jgi:hypothetical protein